MRQILLKYSRLELGILVAILLFLVIKAVLVTPFTTNTTEFLNTYQYTFADSYDWIANGLRLFENDAISFRNPGYVLLIKLLNSINLLFLLPLIGNLAFFGLIVFVYKTAKKLSSEKIGLVVALVLSLNYSLNLASNSLLADVYAVAFIAGSLYYIFEKRYMTSLVLLSASILFQNIGYLLLAGWLIHYVIRCKKTLLRYVAKRDYSSLAKLVGWAILALSPVLAWNLYKFIKFGDPLYSKVSQVELLNPNFDSIDFYGINILTMFGYALIPAFIYFAFNHKNVMRSKALRWSLYGLLFNFLFWIVSYDWDDRRFLVYFIPFLFPFLASYLHKLLRTSKAQFLVVLLLFYPSILPIRGYLVTNQAPLYHNVYAIVKTDGSTDTVELKALEREGYDNPFMNLSPSLYSVIHEYDENHEPLSTTYSFYSRYIENNFNLETSDICIDKSEGIRAYLVRSTLMINYNIDLADLNVASECEATL